MLWVLVAGIWMVRQGPPVPERVTPLAEHHVAAWLKPTTSRAGARQ